MSTQPQFSGRGAPGPYGPPPGGPAWPGGPVPPAPANRPKRRGMAVAIVAAVLVAAGGAGVWLWQSGGSDGAGGGDGLAAQADAQLSLTLQDKVPEDWEPEGDEVEYTVGSYIDGYWWTEKQLVREMPNEVVAYDLADGSVAWRLPVPGNGVCLSSREISPEGHVAVLRGDGLGSKLEKGCHQLTVIDITSGKEVWTKELEPVDRELPNAEDRPVIAGGYVHVATDKGARSLSVQDGSPLGDSSSSCRTTDYVGVDDVLVAWRDRCGVAEGVPSDRVLVGYGQDLKMAWAWQFPENEQDVQLEGVLSVEPLVVVVASGSTQQVWRVEPGSGDVNDPGRHSVVTEVVVEVGSDFMAPCNLNKSASLSECPGTVVGDGVIYLRSKLDENGGRLGVVAVDLESGKELWHAQADGELSLAPIRIDDGRLIAYQAQADESRGVVVALDPENGNPTPLAALPPEDPSTARFVENTDFVDGLEWHDGHLAFLSLTVVVTREGLGGGPGSLSTLIYS